MSPRARASAPGLAVFSQQLSDGRLVTCLIDPAQDHVMVGIGTRRHVDAIGLGGGFVEGGFTLQRIDVSTVSQLMQRASADLAQRRYRAMDAAEAREKRRLRKKGQGLAKLRTKGPRRG